MSTVGAPGSVSCRQGRSEPTAGPGPRSRQALRGNPDPAKKVPGNLPLGVVPSTAVS